MSKYEPIQTNVGVLGGQKKVSGVTILTVGWI